MLNDLVVLLLKGFRGPGCYTRFGRRVRDGDAVRYWIGQRLANGDTCFTPSVDAHFAPYRCLNDEWVEPLYRKSPPAPPDQLDCVGDRRTNPYPVKFGPADRDDSDS